MPRRKAARPTRVVRPAAPGGGGEARRGGAPAEAPGTLASALPGLGQSPAEFLLAVTAPDPAGGRGAHGRGRPPSPSGGEPQGCITHAPAGTFKRVHGSWCKHPGCEKLPAFGLPGGKPQWCAAHKPPDAVNAVDKRCGHADCMKIPDYGLPGGQRQWCAAHKPPDAVNVVNKRCVHHGCEKCPDYGLPGGKHKWCASHAAEDAVRVSLRRKRTATTARKASTAASSRPGPRAVRA